MEASACMEHPEERTATGAEKILLAQANNINKAVYRKSLTHLTDFALNKLDEYKHDVFTFYTKGEKEFIIFTMRQKSGTYLSADQCLLICVETL